MFQSSIKRGGDVRIAGLAGVMVGVLAGVLMGATGCAAPQSAGAGDELVRTSREPIEASSATLVVHGMSCPLCANNVDKQLKEVPGVRTVSVDMSSGEVKVGLAESDRPSTAQLKRAVDGSGFTLKSIRVP